MVSSPLFISIPNISNTAKENCSRKQCWISKTFAETFWKDTQSKVNRSLSNSRFVKQS